MDEVADDEVTATDGIDSTRLQIKKSGHPLIPSSSTMLKFQEMVIPGEGNDEERPPGLVGDILDDGNADRIGTSEHACSSPHCMDDPRVMVEELTLRKYHSGNLAIVGASSMRGKAQNRQSQYDHLYSRGGGDGSGIIPGAFRENSGAMPSVWEDVEPSFFQEFLDKKVTHGSNHENFGRNENEPSHSNTLMSSGGMHTKILSRSEFPVYFVKSELKGKGVICRGPVRDGLAADLGGYPRTASFTMTGSETALNPSRETILSPQCIPETRPSALPEALCDGLSLREWLKAGRNKENKTKTLSIFRQIVDLVHLSHSQEVTLQNLRPSFFKLLPTNQVIYLGSSIQKEYMQSVRPQEIYQSDRAENRSFGLGVSSFADQHSKKRKFGDVRNSGSRWPQFSLRSGMKSQASLHISNNFGGPRDSGYGFCEENSPKRTQMSQTISISPHLSNASQMMSTFVGEPLEEKWYTSPEELSERCCTMSSNIYALGVLLFELLGTFGSNKAHAAAMLDLHDRKFPPSFLSENSKEAGFCLWLLHPEASSRPTTREILQSEVVTGIPDFFKDELSLSTDQDDSESELLMHFLVSLEEKKQKDATKLIEDISCLESDIAEIEKRRIKQSGMNEEPHDARGNCLVDDCRSTLGVDFKSSPMDHLRESRLMRNISHLESAYFSVRSDVQLVGNESEASAYHEALRSREIYGETQRGVEEHINSDRLGAFFSGLCKYARYSKFEVRGILRNGDFNSSANVVCSLCFDRDEDYFASAGVSKKIKIYDFHALLNNSVDIHYPAIEMSNKAKLSCICWNSYIRNYLASTDYDGMVKLWDAGSGRTVSNHIEHDRRAWSVDFSQVDPTKLASGSDDCSVKLWSINEKNSISTIKTIANVCCVQFSPYSTHLLSFGSADYKTYCYDLRNVSVPLCILAGHDKAVSYVKFLDSRTIVSASTDSTLKLWDLNKTSSGGLSTDSCILTFKGHTNEKNFVGLSVADGYIACGSETNEVYSYYRSLPMPITSHKFGSIDAITGKETENDNNQFVSSVCWRQKSDMVVAANSSGSIKILQMV